MSSDPAGFVWEWEVATPLVVALVMVEVAYVIAWIGKGRDDGSARRSWGHLVLFTLGLLSVVIALMSPIGANDERLLSMHMLAHDILIWITAPLLIAGVGALLGDMHRLPRPLRGALVFLTRPMVALLVSTVLLWVWHIPAAYGRALENHHLHHLEHLCFLAGYLLYWWPLIAPSWQLGALHTDAGRVIYLLAGMTQSALLGALITFHGTVLYRGYLEAPGASAASVLADQRLAGMVMWIPGMVVFVVVAAVVVGRRAPEPVRSS
ncbi:MAG TPA: cytochrome c oxidase assembly protein [Gemmatimonadaceae bacterium]|nr:cytochrome c oxidase assembly protein [Gemmatimonadaceae bacterium]